MELDLHQLELRYEALRKRSPRVERQLVASLSEVGQQLPVVVVAGGEGRFVLIDGYKRVRALRRLSRDTARATAWEVEEAEALLLERLMRGAGEDALEQGWLLAELHERFGLSYEELSRRFDKSKSWVSRRLSLVASLPGEIQARVRAGEIAAHSAMKYLVPLARANAAAATRLAVAIAPLRLTTRQLGSLYSGFQSGTERTRELILATPQIYLRAQEHRDAAQAAEKSEAQLLLDDLGALAGIARRAQRLLSQGLWQRLMPGETEEVLQRQAEARSSVQSLFTRFDREVPDAGRGHALGDPQAA